MSHKVYVIELKSEVLKERRFREANPNRESTMTCFYVGETGKSRDERFEQHKSGIKSNKYVRKYWLCLRPDLHRNLDFKKCPDAREAEHELAEELRARGHAVWQH